MSDEHQSANPKVFISYSWTSDAHYDWVADLGEKMSNDGIEVILDQWSLEDGHDVTVFMESMVSDPTIKRVIIVSDALYASKADDRDGGVGTETQIISEKVYESVDQNKFVPLVRERDEKGDVCLPIFLKSRKYIDFSDLDSEAEAYDQLIRNIFERPLRPKPSIGKAPSYIFDVDATVVASAQKAKRFQDVVATGKGSASVSFEDFEDEFLANFDDLRMTFAKEEADTWCDRIKANIESALTHRDIFVDVIRTGVAHLPSEQFMPLLLGFLEKLLPYCERPDVAGAYYKCSQDNYPLLCYEFFLYTTAAFIKAKKYSEARRLLDFRYVAPGTFAGANLQGHSFTDFNRYAESLEEQCAVQGNSRRLSVMADFVHDRSVRKDLRFSDILQADVLLWIAARGRDWYPRCMVYSKTFGKFELFLRAASKEGFAPLGILLDFENPNELLQVLASEEMQKTWESEGFWRADVTLECFNFEELQRIWNEN
jgi:hypothetical protein